ncbi:hypothetical protein ACLOJK_036909 [Asimina triloba]
MARYSASARDLATVKTIYAHEVRVEERVKMVFYGRWCRVQDRGRFFYMWIR